MDNQAGLEKDIDEEISLKDIIDRLVKRWRIVLGMALLILSVAVVYSIAAPKIYKIDSLLEIGTIYNGGASPIETVQVIKEKKDNDVYGIEVRRKLNIPESRYPKIATKGMDSSNLVNFSVNSSNPDMAKQILETINDQIIAEHEKILVAAKNNVNGIIDIEKQNIERLQNKIKSLEVERQTLEDKVTALQKLSIGNNDLNIQFILIDANSQLEKKKQEIENLYMLINASDNKINSLTYDLSKCRYTIVVKIPTVSENFVEPSLLVNSVLGVVLGIISGILLSLGMDWWKNGNEPK